MKGKEWVLDNNVPSKYDVKLLGASSNAAMLSEDQSHHLYNRRLLVYHGGRIYTELYAGESNRKRRRSVLLLTGYLKKMVRNHLMIWMKYRRSHNEVV